MKCAKKLSIEYRGGRLLVIDWVAPPGPWDDSLMFVFGCGMLTAEQQSAITLRDNELKEYRFVRDEEAKGLLRPYV